MCLGSESEIKDFILEDRIKIPLSLVCEVLGIMINTNLTFYSHLKQLCKTSANKLNALTRIISHLGKLSKLFSPNLDFLCKVFKQSHQ